MSMTDNRENMSIEYAVCVLESIGNGLTLSNENDREEACVLAIQAIDKVQQFETIGTIEELQALKEKSVAKKVIVKKAENIELDVCDEKGNVHLCPNCNDYIVCSDMKHCWNCGQTLEH